MTGEIGATGDDCVEQRIVVGHNVYPLALRAGCCLRYQAAGLPVTGNIFSRKE